MNLAAKLDRLRGPAASRAGTGSDSLAGDLAKNRAFASPARSDVATLADALQAEVVSGDLLLRRSRYSLPAAEGDGSDLADLPEVYGLPDPDWVYLDTETTGLSGGSGNLAFMVGAARYRDPGKLEIRQYILGGFSAESRMLHELVDWLGPGAVLVSYNGKCFDLPLLTARLGMHRIDRCLARLSHLDLMFSVRRAYRDHWPDCRLQTAERRLLGLHRKDDLPGAEAPLAWQFWLRRKETALLAGVLAHNHQDVASLALLHRRLLTDYAGSCRSGLDHAAIGRAWREAGHPERARQVWERAGDRLNERGCLQLASLYRRRGDWPRAEAMWLKLHLRGSVPAALALSKYYEHRKRDFRKAMELAACCGPDECEPRFARLRGKLGSNLELPLSSDPSPLNPQRR